MPSATALETVRVLATTGCPGQRGGRAGMTEPTASRSARSGDERWDAGDLGCGELVLELQARLARLRPGQILELVARDPGAPADLPAWCRMTGHALLRQKHPV